MVEFLQRYMQQHNEVELSALGMGIVPLAVILGVHLFIFYYGSVEL
jgi:hypothetical protein